MPPSPFSTLHTIAFLERLGENVAATSMAEELIQKKERITSEWFLHFLEHHQESELLFRILEEEVPLQNPAWTAEIPASLSRLGSALTTQALQRVPPLYKHRTLGKLFESNARLAINKNLSSLLEQPGSSLVDWASAKSSWLIALGTLNLPLAQAELARWMKEPNDPRELARLIFYPRALLALYPQHPQAYSPLQKACDLASKLFKLEPDPELAESLKTSVTMLYPGLSWKLPRNDLWNRRWALEDFEVYARLWSDSVEQLKHYSGADKTSRIYVLARVFAQKQRYKDAIKLLSILPNPEASSELLLQEIVRVALQGQPPARSQCRALWYAVKNLIPSMVVFELWYGLGRIFYRDLEWLALKATQLEPWQLNLLMVGCLEECLVHHMPLHPFLKFPTKAEPFQALHLDCLNKQMLIRSAPMSLPA
jgi:hypothetical protein